MDLVKEYLKVFDYYYNLYQEKLSEKSKSKKRTSSSSVRVLKNLLTNKRRVTAAAKIRCANTAP